jgi:hypothetical protein
MVIYEGNDHRGYNCPGCDDCLAPEKEHIVSELNFSRICAGTVKHDQTETGQK